MRRYIIWRPLQVEAKTATGLRLRNPLSDLIHNALYFFGVWEPALTQFLSSRLGPGDVFIDIGANVGAHTMLAAQRVGASGRVHAIEASPTIFAILQSNLARNGITNVTAHNIAVSDKNGTITVFLHDASNMGRTTTLLDNAVAAGGCIREETIAAKPLPEIVPLDDLLRAKVIKIDVEGSEWPVLQGLALVLTRLRPDVSIVVEVDRNALISHSVSIPEFLAFFTTRGYRGERLAYHSPALCISGAASPALPVEMEFDMADLVFRRGA